MMPLKKKKDKPKKLKERHKWILFDKDWNIIETITFNRSYNREDIREQLSKSEVMCLLIAVENGINKPKLFVKNIELNEENNETS